MKRTTLFIDEQLEHDLKALSRRQARPVAAVVREAMAQYVARALEGPTTLGFVAAGRSGHADTAERHEDVLWTALQPHGPRTARRRPSPRAKTSARPSTAAAHKSRA